jgi:hypothetical protein
VYEAAKVFSGDYLLSFLAEDYFEYLMQIIRLLIVFEAAHCALKHN